MARPIIFGEIPGIKEGQLFKGRKEMMPTSFHRVWGRGIDSDKKKVLQQLFYQVDIKIRFLYADGSLINLLAVIGNFQGER